MEFGEQLREWRGHRRMSQLDLATEAGISSRHVSFLETCRSRPTEGMILRLSAVLDIPARDTGMMFSAAGFRPRFGTSPAQALDSLPPVISEAIGLILDRHDPYPGVVFDHEYNVLSGNRPFAALAGMAGIEVKPGINFLDAYLSPSPLRDIIANWRETAADLVHRIRGEAWLQGPRSALSRRIERLAKLPEVAAALEAHPDSDRFPVLPISMKLGGKTLSFITTLTTFGSVQDALAQGVLIESFFPADAETKAHFEG